MKKLIIIRLLMLCGLVLFGASCKQDVREELQILIQNKTESSIQITLYPKAEYLSGGLYRFSDTGSGCFNTEFSLSPNNEGYSLSDKALFVSGNLNIKPYTLAAQVFDSICISISNEEQTIKFTQETVNGYSENIFSENSTWNYQMVEIEEYDFRVRRTNAHCYWFLILKEKMTIDENSF